MLALAAGLISIWNRWARRTRFWEQIFKTDRQSHS